MALYTNRSSRSDFVRNALTSSIVDGENVYIAAAFLTDTWVIEDLASHACQVRLVVRLGFPTSPMALEKLLSLERVQVRYFTSKSFHPKLYIFGSRHALVGSANLTSAAINVNQEVVVKIPRSDDRLAELMTLFSDYWSEANVLTPKALNQYSALYRRHATIEKEIEKLYEEIRGAIGHVEFANIRRGEAKVSSEQLYLEEYRKAYQECVAAFREIRAEYEAAGRRKADASSIPLRLEIDSFFSFVRDTRAVVDSWQTTPIGWGDVQRSLLHDALSAWFETTWPHFEDTIVNENYPRLMSVFSSESSVLESKDDELFEALLTVHAFHDRLRFFEGGIDGLRAAFLGSNQAEKIRRSLSYLVFGEDGVEVRMARLIFDSHYRLAEFGQSGVQELVGWCNQDDLPVVNGRTTKILRYFGFDVQQL